MSRLKIGDIVARKSYGEDVFFKVVEMKEEGGSFLVTLQGLTHRLEADAPEHDLVQQSNDRVSEYRKKFTGRTGRV